MKSSEVKVAYKNIIRKEEIHDLKEVNKDLADYAGSSGEARY